MCSAAWAEADPILDTEPWSDEDPLSSIYLQPPYLSVEQGLALVDEEGPRGLTPETLRQDLLWLASMQRLVEAISARWIAELDSRQEEGGPDLGFSCSQWLHDALHLAANAAAIQVRTARQLQHLPDTMAALARGRISGQQASVICQAVREAEGAGLQQPRVESELLGAAAQADPRELLEAWWQLRYRADQDAGEEAEDERHRRRWLHLRETWSGSFRLEGQLDAEGEVTLKTALKGLIGKPEPDDQRSPAQRRADAVVQLARRCLDSGELPERGGEKPHLVLVAELSTLRLEPGSPPGPAGLGSAGERADRPPHQLRGLGHAGAGGRRGRHPPCGQTHAATAGSDPPGAQAARSTTPGVPAKPALGWFARRRAVRSHPRTASHTTCGTGWTAGRPICPTSASTARATTAWRTPRTSPGGRPVPLAGYRPPRVRPDQAISERVGEPGHGARSVQ